MANPGAGDKCASAPQQCAPGCGLADTNHNRHRSPMPSFGRLSRVMTAVGRRRSPGHFALSAPPFLHSDMNFLRSLPWTPLVSASFEHSSEAAVRGFSAFFSAGAILVAGAGVAGAVVCAKAVLIRKRDAKAVAAAREVIVIMGAPRVEEVSNFPRSG